LFLHAKKINLSFKFDEGIAGIEEHFGTQFALPATAEKGYIDVSVTVDNAGGHSSTPPDHTASEQAAFAFKFGF
jgi:Gly-Xaa carboxypeptidase